MPHKFMVKTKYDKHYSRSQEVLCSMPTVSNCFVEFIFYLLFLNNDNIDNVV